MAEARAAERNYQVRSRSAVWALERAYAWAPLVLRLAVGSVLLAHGVQKFLAPAASAAGFEAMGFAPGIFWAMLAALVETLGGAALLIGFFTRFAALANLVSQLVAMLVVHLPNGFFLASEPGQGNGIEFNLVNVGSLLALVILGGGSISIDHMLHRRTGLLETRRTEPPATTSSSSTSTTGSTPSSSSTPGTKI